MANEHSNIVPNMSPTAKVADFKFWCQKVLPLVYDDSLSYYEVLNKMVVYLNQVIDNINADIDNVEELEADFLLLQSYVNNFFDDIDQLVTYTERAEAAEEAANGYAASAAESATNASTSALNAMDARDAAVVAKNQALSALTSAQSAATSAAESATNAASSALTALDAKDAAAGSALSASGSATNASASATAAQQSFTLADAARVAAQEAAEDAETAAELIDMDATASDVGKAIIVKTVGGGKVTAYEFGEAGGGGGTGGIINVIEDVAIASFDDGTDAPVVELVVEVDPVQSGSGDPSPANERPISGWTECNISAAAINVWDEEWEIGLISASDGQNTNSDQYCRTKNYISVKPGTDYYLKNTPSPIYLRRYGSSKNYIGYTQAIGDGIWHCPDDVYYIRFCWDGTTYNNDISLNYPSTETDYHAYSGNSAKIEFPNAAGTVYGATLNVVNEKLRVTKQKYVFTGNESWAYNSGGFFYTSLMLSGINVSNYYLTENGVKLYLNGNNGQCRIYLEDNSFMTSETDVNTLLGNYGFLYELATPVEYNLTDIPSITTLLGKNNFWADTGNINLLKYLANGKQYVDEKDSLVKALIAKELDSMIADTSLVANDFRIVNNTLYKITTNIASGGTLTPGTNCVATTIGAELKSLLNT